MKSRVDEAVKLFESGFNCCQSVFTAYSDIFGFDRETSLKMTSSMGGGIGKMREVCGAVSAMALLAGLKEGNDDPDNQEAKTAIYEKVRELADKFKTENDSIVCRELLKDMAQDTSAAPSIRTKEYYGKRPCSGFVAYAANLVEEFILDEMVD